MPPACAGCGRYGDLLCRDCLAAFARAGNPQDRFASADPGTVIGDALELAIAAFAHAGPARRSLQRLKYGGAGRLAAALARAALPVLNERLALSGAQVLIPVPVHPARLRQRGYNQARLLADELGRAASLPVADLLERRRATARQHGLGKVARLHNLRGAFAVREGHRAPATAILVDDILTTSATLEACAQALRRAGSEHLFGFAIAREV